MEKEHESTTYAEAVEEITSYEVEADSVKTLGQCDQHIEHLKDEVVNCSRLLDRTEQAKKDVMGAWRDTIKHQREMLKKSMDNLGLMEDRKRVLAAGPDFEDERPRARR